MFVIRFFISYSCKAVFEVCDDVVDMLCADGKTDGILMDSRGFELLFGKLRMSSRSRMDNKEFTSATFASREKIFNPSMKRKASSLPHLISNVKIEPPPLGKYFSYSAWSG